jgi:flagellin-like protein
MRYANGRLETVVRGERGITGLETAIVLIAFVVVSSVFAFAARSTGLFSSDKAEQTIQAGLEEARGSLELRGAVQGAATLTAVALTTVTAEAVGTGDGVQTGFTLGNAPVHTNSETVYVNAVAQTRVTDYTINFATGAITFIVAPGNTLAVTADYQHGQDAVGTGDGSTVAFMVTNTPVVPGSQTVYVDGTVQTADLDYTANYDTGVVTFKAAPGNNVRVDAVYTHYVVTGVKVTLANAAGGQPVEMTPGVAVIGYSDADTLATVTNYTITKYNADSDNLLEVNELFELSVDTSGYGLTDADEFTLQVKPPRGAVVALNRTVPKTIGATMDLG